VNDTRKSQFFRLMARYCALGSWVCANLSGKNNPNEKQPLEIALEGEGISFVAELEGGFGVWLEKKPQRG
jgi:hypothetical protein